MYAIITEVLGVVQGEVLDILHILILFIVHILIIVKVNGCVLWTGGVSMLRLEINIATLFQRFVPDNPMTKKKRKV